MSKTIEEKVQEFMSNAKEAFKNQIPRDKVDDIAVTDCAEKDGAYEVTGSVGATSPTGKLKTFGYTATVTADANGGFTLSGLQVREF